MTDPKIIPLTGPLVRLDGPQEQLLVDIDPATFAKIGKKGIPVGNPGHCKLVNPLIDEKSAEQIENPLGHAFFMGSTKLLKAFDYGFNALFDGVDMIDRTTFANGLDRLTGVSKIKDDRLQSAARWLERATVVSTGVGVYNAIRTKSLTQAMANTRGFWAQTWPLATAIFLTSSGIASDMKQGLDAIDKDHTIFPGESRKYARWGSYAMLFIGGALALNFPTKAGYRKVVSPANPPPSARPTAPLVGLLAAGGYFLLQAYWDNASSQERLLNSPFYNEGSGAGLYKPWKWDYNYAQGQTSAGYAIYWGLVGAAWAGLLSWQTKVTNRVSTKLFGFGSEVLAIKAGSAEQLFIDRGTNKVSKGLRAAAMRLFTPKRFAFTGLSTLAGLPMGVGLGQMMERSLHYSSTAAISGTPFRALITSPLSTAGVSYFTAANGYATAWSAYTFNMIPVNYSWSACSKMGENLFQVARVLADDYQSTQDPQEKRRLRTLLFKTYAIAFDDGKTAAKGNEKLKIAALLKTVGIDAPAIALSLTQ